MRLNVIAQDLTAKPVISWAGQQEVWPIEDRAGSSYTPHSHETSPEKEDTDLLEVQKAAKKKDRRTGTTFL